MDISVQHSTQQGNYSWLIIKCEIDGFPFNV